jgi:putative sigma-54 modulation protein
MQLKITARGYKVPDRLKKYIYDKLGRKEKLYQGVIDTDVVLSYEKKTQIAEFKVTLSDKTIIVIEKSDDIFKSIDLALDNIERQIKRFKEKRREHGNKKIADSLVA